MKLNRFDMPNASSILKCSEDFEKMTDFYKYFVHFSTQVYTYVSNLPKMFLIVTYALMIWQWLQ